jgi:dihydrodipicolinate synthase/N-acetylneuraminate lyase
MVAGRTAVGCDRFATLMRGVCPVIEVPFHADGSVDYEGFQRVLAHVLTTGVTAVVCPAFASEFYKLSDSERASLRANLLAQTSERDDVLAVVGVAQHATRLAVAEAVTAVQGGAGAINLLPPHFVSLSRAEVVGHLRTVLSEVEPTPVIIQHAPGLTGSVLGAQDLCALAEEHANLRMVKVEALPPGSFISALENCQARLPSMVGYGGVMMIDALRRGAIGVQPGCSAVEIYQKIWDLWSRGEQEAAEALHRRLLPFVSYWMQEIELIIQVEKTITKARGFIGEDHCRAPGRALDAEEQRAIRQFLSEFAEVLGPTPNDAATSSPERTGEPRRES